ncbi:hypothetical protein BDY19DRAFT_941123 [Irpex rosettiformis]|uniref:Uncharacterized protein n=1 Tax=Irpex rosettiformis TaxID=378272 RepID=A0ACB8U647_9APHY|nr:hypothetical protein BDY19DRAFT_941123 [Irpex rosettiformis]
MTVALNDDFHDHPDMAALYEQKLSIEGSSPKPCIVPGNALQLIDDNPTPGPRSHTSSNIIILDSDHDRERQGSARELRDSTTMESSADQGSTERRPVPRVRFRSRVRITSGLRRSKHLGNPTGSHSSSASGSPSSSISAPIRWQADENGAWGPIGRRLSAYAHAHGRSKRSSGLQRALSGQPQPQPQARAKMDIGERTPLIKPGRPTVAYVDAGLDGGASADDERVGDGEDMDSEDEEGRGDIALRAAALRREEEAVFGKWPWRLFNRHVRCVPPCLKQSY